MKGVLLLPTVAVGLVGYFWFTAPAQPEFAAKLWVLRGNDEQVLVRAFVGSQPLREPFATEVELVLQGAGVDPKRWRAYRSAYLLSSLESPSHVPTSRPNRSRTRGPPFASAASCSRSASVITS